MHFQGKSLCYLMQLHLLNKHHPLQPIKKAGCIKQVKEYVHWLQKIIMVLIEYLQSFPLHIQDIQTSQRTNFSSLYLNKKEWSTL